MLQALLQAARAMRCKPSRHASWNFRRCCLAWCTSRRCWCPSRPRIPWRSTCKIDATAARYVILWPRRQFLFAVGNRWECECSGGKIVVSHKLNSVLSSVVVAFMFLPQTSIQIGRLQFKPDFPVLSWICILLAPPCAICLANSHFLGALSVMCFITRMVDATFILTSGKTGREKGNSNRYVSMWRAASVQRGNIAQRQVPLGAAFVELAELQTRRFSFPTVRCYLS